MKKFINLHKIDIENKVFIYPTDTVYGIGGDPFDILPTLRIVHIKGRVQKPFPVLIGNVDKVFSVANVGRVAKLFIDRFWPGKLTIVFPAKIDIPSLLGDKYIGLRVPGNSDVIKLINMVGGFLIGTSANISGQPPALSCISAYQYFGEKVDWYICDDKIIRGVPSTVIRVEEATNTVYIVRKGAINVKELSKYCKEVGCSVSMLR